MTLGERPPTAAADIGRRFKVLFPDAEHYYAAQAFETVNSRIPVRSAKRNFISIDLPPTLRGISEMENTLETQLTTFQEYFGATVVEDYRYELEGTTEIFDPATFGPEEPSDPSLDDVLAMIRAPEAWDASNRGQGVAIAVVDTGINGSRPEFPVGKQLSSWQSDTDTPWTDYDGHGTMCACIAAGTTAAGGAFNGVAPDASIIACKTRFFDGELVAIYDYLIDLATNQGIKIVATNSFGINTGTPPEPPPNTLFVDALKDAMAAGIHIFFSAGNYHDDAGGRPDECSPTSIWLHKCRADVMSVATCKPDRTMWYYSSRGPGQYYGDRDMGRKPDVTAPTPQNGRVVYGDSIRSLPNGWGTSGASPQVAGLAALLLTQNPTLSQTALSDTIRNTASPLGHGEDCEGAGLIDCKNALDNL